MKLLIFYIVLTAPLMVLIGSLKYISWEWFALGMFLYFFYNIFIVNRKLKQKGYNVGLFAHLNPFNKKSQELYSKVYFEE